MTQIITDKLITKRKAVIIGVAASIISGLIGFRLELLGNSGILTQGNIFIIIAIPFIAITVLASFLISEVIAISLMIAFLIVIIIQGISGAIIGGLLWIISIRSRKLNIWRFAFRICIILMILGFLSFILIRFGMPTRVSDF